MKTVWRSVFLAMVLLVAIARGGNAREAIHVGLFVETMTNPYFVAVAEGAQDEAKRLGVTLTVLAAARGGDLAGEIRAIEDMIQRRVDVIAAVAIDPVGVVPVLQKAIRAGIPCITHSDDAPDAGCLAFVGPDQKAAARDMAIWVGRTIGGSGKVAIIEGVAGNYTSQQRVDGYKEGFQRYPGITVATVLPGNWQRDLGLRAAEDILVAHPDVRAILAANDEMALGAVQAVRSSRRRADVIVTGFNGVSEAINAVYRGDLAATVLIVPYTIGQMTVRTAWEIARGQRPRERVVNTGYTILDRLVVSAVASAVK